MHPADGDEQHQSDRGAQLAVRRHNGPQPDHRAGDNEFGARHAGALKMRADAGHHRHDEANDQPPAFRVRGGEAADGDDSGEMVEADDRMAEA